MPVVSCSFQDSTHPEETMKKIYLVRHGKAETPIPEKPDFERIMTERGESDMQLMSKTMKKLGITPSVIISSPALRAYQTARIASKELGYPIKKIRTRTSLYDQFDSAYNDILTTLDDSFDSVMMVGHNPSITEYAWFLSKKFRKELPTSGLAVIECKVKSWADIKQGKGKCVCFDSPGLKDKSGNEKMLRTALQSALSEQIIHTLNYYDDTSEKTLKKSIAKSSEAIAKAYIKKVSRKAKGK